MAMYNPLTVIELTDPHTSDIECCEKHREWPLHIETECNLLKDTMPYSLKYWCESCGQQLNPQILNCSGCVIKRISMSVEIGRTRTNTVTHTVEYLQ